jgi:ATP/ADP translocase
VLVVAASVAAALIGLALGDVGRAIVGWFFNALTQPVAALTTSVLYFTLLQVRDEAGTPQA